MAAILNPASTYKTSPVIPLAKSEHKKAPAFPTSSAVMFLPKGALEALKEADPTVDRFRRCN